MKNIVPHMYMRSTVRRGVRAVCAGRGRGRVQLQLHGRTLYSSTGSAGSAVTSASATAASDGWTHPIPEEDKGRDAVLRRNVGGILRHSVRLQPHEQLMVIYDRRSPLATLLTQAYRSCLNNGKEDGSTVRMMDFDAVQGEEIQRTIDALKPGDLVVLIQTDAFNLREYRFRLELFKRGLKNIEHVHLGLIPEGQIDAYIDALAFNPEEEGPLAHAIKKRLDTASRVVVTCRGGSKLYYETAMEPALLNIGDYNGMKNVGGTFPVGEVFTEPKELRGVNGEVMVYAFPNASRVLEFLPTPIPLSIASGTVALASVSSSAPTSFREVLEIVNAVEGEICVREFGLGLNKAMGRSRPVNDVTAFERQLGLHLSLGKKHTVYKKPEISTKKSRFHIDLFIDVEKVEVDDGEVIYNDGRYALASQ